MKKTAIVSLVLSLGVVLGNATVGEASPINLLSNPGFETGSFAGWTVGGNSIQTGVATDGTVILNADPPFPPNFQNVRSGTWAGNALVQNGQDPVERIILSQTLAVLPGENVNVGFWLGNDSASSFGMQILDTHTQIFIDGVGLLPPSGIVIIGTGGSPADFRFFGGSFNTGTRTSINVAFAINGSGTSRAGVSFDDLLFNSESPAAIPEPATLFLLGAGLVPALRRRFRRNT